MEAKVVLGALKMVGDWVLKNPNVALDALDKVVIMPVAKKASNIEEHLLVLEAKTNQLGAAALELEQKIDSEIIQLQKEIHTIKKLLSIMSIVLGAAIISIVILAIL